MKTLALVVLVVFGSSTVQEAPPVHRPGPEHQWLQQLVGEWKVTAEAVPAPGAEPFRMESTESVRSIGGLWVVADGRGVVAGKEITTLMTLGYDPAKKTFVGTWIDSMQPNLWTYTGSLDAARKVLTLESQGPSFTEPSKTSKYRDAFELKSADHKVLTSQVQGADGTWTTYLTADYRKKT